MRTFWFRKNAEKYRDYLNLDGRAGQIVCLNRLLKPWTVSEVYHIDYSKFVKWDKEADELAGFLRKVSGCDIQNPIDHYSASLSEASGE